MKQSWDMKTQVCANGPYTIIITVQNAAYNLPSLDI